MSKLFSLFKSKEPKTVPRHPFSKEQKISEYFASVYSGEVELSEGEILSALDHLDDEAERACIRHLITEYPALSDEQAKRIINLIFEPNFKAYLPNHFNRSVLSYETVGQPFIWLLHELKVGGIRYIWRNNIWQIHWHTGCRFPRIDNDEESWLKFLLTSGPSDEPGKSILSEHRLVFWAYSWTLKFDYPFPEDADLSMRRNDFINELNLPPSPDSDDNNYVNEKITA